MSDQYVTRQQAAELLGVDARTVDRYAKTGKLKKHERLSKVLFLREDVLLLNQPQPVAAGQ